MSVPNGYTKEMIKEMLGTAHLDPPGESGNAMRRRKGQEVRDGKRPFPVYKTKQTGPNFDDDGKYIYPEGCLLYTSPSPRDATLSRMPSSA